MTDVYELPKMNGPRKKTARPDVLGLRVVGKTLRPKPGQHYIESRTAFEVWDEKSRVDRIPKRTVLWLVMSDVYTLLTRPYDGADWEPRFAFHAADLSSAHYKAKTWARYHGMGQGEVNVRPATWDEEAYNLHDEWVV